MRLFFPLTTLIPTGHLIHRLVNVMRALHEVRYSKQTDTEEEAEDDAYASSPFAEDEGYSEDDLYEGLEAGEDDGSGDRWE